MIEVAVQGATLKETITPPTPSVSSKKIESIPSNTNKAEGKGIFCGDIVCNYILTPPTGFDTPSTLSVILTISPTAKKYKADNKYVIRKGDMSTIGNWSFSNSISGATMAGTISCEIDDPGQKKVKSN